MVFIFFEPMFSEMNDILYADCPLILNDNNTTNIAEGITDKAIFSILFLETYPNFTQNH